MASSPTAHTHPAVEDVLMDDAESTHTTVDPADEDEAIESDLESEDSIYGHAPPSDSRQYSRWSQLVHLRHSRDRSRPFPEESTDEEWRANLCPVEDEADEVNYLTSDESDGFDRRPWLRQANKIMIATDTRIQSASTESLFPGARIAPGQPWNNTQIEPQIPADEVDPEEGENVFREAVDEMVHLDAATRSLLDELLEYQHTDENHPLKNVSLHEFRRMIDEHLEPTNPEAAETVKLLQQLNEALKRSEVAYAAYLNSGGLEFNEIGPYVVEQQRIKQELKSQKEKLLRLETPLWRACMSYLDESRRIDRDPVLSHCGGRSSAIPVTTLNPSSTPTEEEVKEEEMEAVDEEELERDELLYELEKDREGRLDWMFDQLEQEYDAMRIHLTWSEVMIFLKQDSYMGSSSNRFIKDLFSQPSFTVERESLVKDWSGWTIYRSNELDETVRADRDKLRALDLLVDLVTEISDDRLESYEKLRDEYDCMVQSYEQLCKSVELIWRAYDEDTRGGIVRNAPSEVDDAVEVEEEEEESKDTEMCDSSTHTTMTTTLAAAETSIATTHNASSSSTIGQQMMTQLAAESARIIQLTESARRTFQPNDLFFFAQRRDPCQLGYMWGMTHAKSVSPVEAPFQQLTRQFHESQSHLKESYERINRLLLDQGYYYEIWSDLLDTFGARLEQTKTDTIIPKPLIESLIGEISSDFSSTVAWDANAISVLHHAAEAAIVDLFDTTGDRIDAATIILNRMPTTEHRYVTQRLAPLESNESLPPIQFDSNLTRPIDCDELQYFGTTIEFMFQPWREGGGKGH